MNRNLLVIMSVSLLLTAAKPVNAQVFEDAGQYMDYISKQNSDLTVVYLSYVSAAAHNKSARKVEKRRFEVLDAIYNTRQNIAGMSPWKGDRSFKDTTVAYLKMLEHIFREDYGKIVNLEEIAEQSYDAMEAYLLAQEKASEKLEEARLKQTSVTKKFAANNNVNLIESDDDELSQKSKKAAEVNKYYNVLYLIFFKPYKQEMYLLDAAEKGNLVALEQNINSLEKIAVEGLDKIKAIKPFNGDATLIEGAQDAMHFYKSEAKRSKVLTDFFLSKEKFEKTKKSFESKREKSKKDVEEYNESVKDMNEAANEYNNLNNQLNKERTAMLNSWNKKISKFMDQHTPVQKKVK